MLVVNCKIELGRGFELSSHEPIHKHRKVVAGSNRNFGLTFSAVFLLIAVWPWLRHGDGIRYWAICGSLVLITVSLFANDLLSPLNRIWFKIGLAMHGIVSPVIMALLFYGAVTPMAFILRLTKKDILRLKAESEPTYWIVRNPPGPDKASMKNQF